MSSTPSLSRTLLVAGALVLTLSACGRRGALEAPPDAAAAQAQPAAAAGGAPQGTLPSPVGTPRSRPAQGFAIPNKPFILDPLL